MNKILLYLNKKNCHLVSTSYGSMLGMLVSTKAKKIVSSHSLINPMPFAPFKKFKNPLLNLVFFVNKFKYGLYWFVRTKIGLKVLSEIGKIFNLNILAGQTKTFNLRKFILIQNAIKRFIWVSKNVDWTKSKVDVQMNPLPRQIIYGAKDELFGVSVYMELKSEFAIEKETYLNNGGHMLLTTNPKDVGFALSEFISELSEKEIDIKNIA